MRQVPLLLTLFRAALAPVVAVTALRGGDHAIFAACLIGAFVSDIFDGVIARRLGIATPGLRRLDSIADSLFYVATTFAVWLLRPEAITSRVALLGVLVALELVRYAFDFIKFRREASYHMWSSKLWGIALFAAFVSLLVFDADNVLVTAAIVLGIFCDIEGLAISFVLKRWQSDVPTLAAARRLARRQSSAS
jgi:CDP-diacylglycerol--glycerol-3-phosphate 3-phosphatidyltransferase